MSEISETSKDSEVILDLEIENQQLKARIAELEDIAASVLPYIEVAATDNHYKQQCAYKLLLRLNNHLRHTPQQTLVELQVNEAEKISSIIKECGSKPRVQYLDEFVVDDDVTALDIYKSAIFDSMKEIFDYQSQLQSEGVLQGLDKAPQQSLADIKAKAITNCSIDLQSLSHPKTHKHFINYDGYIWINSRSIKEYANKLQAQRCFDGGSKQTCDCPDCSNSLVDCKGGE